MQTLEMEKQAIELELTRVIRASRARVYEAWTKPEALRRWFAPGSMVVSIADLDVREGGAFTIAMQDSNDASRSASAHGVYLKLVQNELIQFSWSGNCDASETSLVTVSLREVEGGTELTLRHERFSTELSRDRHQQGWSNALDKLCAVWN